MYRRLVSTYVAFLVVVTSVCVKGAIAYPDPPGGWSYLFDADQRVVGDDNLLLEVPGRKPYRQDAALLDRLLVVPAAYKHRIQRR